MNKSSKVQIIENSLEKGVNSDLIDSDKKFKDELNDDKKFKDDLNDDKQFKDDLNDDKKFKDDLNDDKKFKDDLNDLIDLDDNSNNLIKKIDSDHTNELTRSNDSYSRAKFINQMNRTLFREESQLSQSAPNLKSSDNYSVQLTSEEFSARFIEENLKLFNYYHNSNNQLDCENFESTNEEAILFKKDNEIKELNKNAIDFLTNFAVHKYLHQYQAQSNNELINGTQSIANDELINFNSLLNERRSFLIDGMNNQLNNNQTDANRIDDLQIKTDQLIDSTINNEIVQNKVNKDLTNLKSRTNVNFLYKNEENLDLIESIDMASEIDYNNLDFNDATIKKNRKILFSSNDPENDEEILDHSNIQTDYSVATMLEQNDFAVSNIYNLARELKRTYLFKILIMGDANTGKTSFVKRFICNSTPRQYMPTIGIEFSMKIIELKDENREIKLQLWDSCGEKTHNSLSKLYFRDAVAALIFFDCSREASFKNVDKWKEQLDTNVRLTDGSKVPTILIGNKCDLKKDGLCKDQTFIKEFCHQFEFNEFFYSSAKTNKNVKDSIYCLIKLIFESRMEFHYNIENNIKLEESEEEPKSRFKCFC